MGFLNNDGVIYLWSKVKALFNKGITDLSIKGRTITFTKGDGTTGTITTQDTNTEYDVVSKKANGLAPKLPDETTTTKYLRQDGTWAVPPNDNTTYSDATQENHGLMPKEDKKKLDGIEAGANNYAHPTSPGYKHIPSGGSSGQILRWLEDGTATWGEDNDTTYSVFKGATASNKGQSGLVPAPQMGANKGLLFGNGVWSTIYLDAYDVSNGCEIVLDANNLDIDHISSVIVPLANANKHGLISKTLFNKIDGLPTATEISNTYAKKSDITNMYVYKGSVADVSKLPTTGQQVGWVYNIESASVYGGAGMNVAWNGTAWDPLGEIFTITAITNAELDKICV